MKKYVGSVSIVPSGLVFYGPSKTDDLVQEAARVFNCPVGTQMIQVVVRDDRTGDWSGSAHDIQVTYLPFHLIYGKREGERILFTAPISKDKSVYATQQRDFELAEVELELAQRGSRYERYGTFEQVLMWLLIDQHHNLSMWDYVEGHQKIWREYVAGERQEAQKEAA